MTNAGKIELDDFMRQLAAGMPSRAGDGFFSSLVQGLCSTLGIKYALVGQVDNPAKPHRITTLAVARDGQLLAPFERELAGTPCATVVGHQPRVYPRAVQAAFPADRLLVENEAQSYVGVPLFDAKAQPSGLLLVLDDKPLEEWDSLLTLLTFLGGRASAELERVAAENALRLSEHRYAMTLSAAETGSWEWDVVSNALRWSDDIEPLFGFRRGEFARSYEAYLACIHPDDRKRVVSAIESALRGGEAPYRIEHRVVWPNGEIHWLAGRGTVLRDEQGNPQRVLGVVWDITDRKRTEETLERTRHRLQTLYDAIPDMILLQDVSGRIVAVNDETVEFTGFSREELLAIPFDDLCGEGYSWEMARGFVAETLKGRELDFEWKLRKHNGDEFPVEMRLRRIDAGAASGQPAVMAVVTDISSRKRVDEVIRMLARSAVDVSFDEFLRECVSLLAKVYQARFAFVGRLVEPQNDHVQTLAVWAGKGAVENFRYCLAGTPCQDILDLKAELISRDAWKLYPEDEMLKQMEVESYFGAPLLATDGRLLGLVSVMDVRPMELDTWVRPVLEVFATRLANEIERFEAIAELKKSRDLLEQRVEERTAELQAVNRELESFAYSVSHDLRAPLRAIDGFSRAVQEDFGAKLGRDGSGFIDRIRGGAQRMSDLIDALLRLSRISQAELTRKDVALSKLAQTVATELKEQERDRHVDFDIQRNLTVYGDPVLLRIVLENVLGNALKYTRDAQAARIELSAKLQDGEMVYCVADNGVGFDMTYAEKLFGAFQRLHKPEEFEGLGIGLATVQRIIHRHGGLIWAQSEPGEGARFYFTLGKQRRSRRRANAAA